eukprot:TRINITY_DN1560_c0_g1_i1.p1 TRINITY_DN1560_c0_g1~~TRINITY_DN1560_c0_g1_i1.p1  ORF type:complete len:623 (+),score=215.17 TRINITY_DN1560_c0_g1_i1:207-2075(+)
MDRNNVFGSIDGVQRRRYAPTTPQKHVHGSGRNALTQSMPDVAHMQAPPTTHHTTRISGETLSTWSRIAQGSGNAVVKILAQVITFDWGQPYRRSSEGNGIGSGFFIDERHIITNAHVVEGAHRIWITLPAEGERRFDAEVIGVCFDVDLAVLRCAPDVPCTNTLQIGDSDSIHFGEEVMTLGYPLGMDSLKLTVGIISGRQDNLFQTDAPLNPGNSGGPMLNKSGRVVGVNVAIVEMSQNVGFAIPIGHLKLILKELCSRPSDKKLLQKPMLGVDFCNSSQAMHSFLGVPQRAASSESDSNLQEEDVHPAPRLEGVYVSKAFKGFPLYEAGVRDGDMLHSFDGHSLDNFGHAKVPWNPDSRVTLGDLMAHVTYDQTPVVEYSRDGELKSTKVILADPENPRLPRLPTVRIRYPPYEQIDYEVIAGMCVMPLCLNHIEQFGSQGSSSFVQQLVPVAATLEKQLEPTLIVSNVFVGSLLSRLAVFDSGVLLKKVNQKEVKTLDDFRKAIAEPVEKHGEKFFTFETKGNELVVLPFLGVLLEEPELCQMHMYEPSQLTLKLMEGSPELAEALEMIKSGTGGQGGMDMMALLRQMAGGGQFQFLGEDVDMSNSDLSEASEVSEVE